MPIPTDPRGNSTGVAAGAASLPGPGASPEPPAPAESAATAATESAKTALAIREGDGPEPISGETATDPRLERLPMQVHVLVKVHSFRVQDLLAMKKGTVVETVHEHTQDVPVRCGGALLLWSEFEVLDQKLAVRVTRLA
jgi:flagellar motor switch protein FliN